MEISWGDLQNGLLFFFFEVSAVLLYLCYVHILFAFSWILWSNLMIIGGGWICCGRWLFFWLAGTVGLNIIQALLNNSKKSCNCC